MPSTDRVASAAGSSVPAVGVIIPTYNRWPILLQCLRHLEAQTWTDFQVVIVDDGSTDETAAELERYRRTAPFPLICLHQINSGPARARNHAIAELSSSVCIMIGDDIFPDPEFVRAHFEFHRTQLEPEAIAIGYTRWSEQGQVVTPFMRWLDSAGIQFAYGDLFAGVAPSYKHFWTSNLSFKTEYLRENPFHEGFGQAAMEDIELGYRLERDHGLRMFFLPGAIAEHLHPTTFSQSCRRALGAGAAAYSFAELWPEHRYALPRSRVKRALLPLLTEARVVLPALEHITNLVNHVWCPNPLLGKVLFLHERYGYDRAAAAHELERI